MRRFGLTFAGLGRYLGRWLCTLNRRYRLPDTPETSRIATIPSAKAGPGPTTPPTDHAGDRPTSGAQWLRLARPRSFSRSWEASATLRRRTVAGVTSTH